ncbi:4'-phosphopantetheinyl transferase family protein [Nonomuraea bangladeshensis]|uniref:4'-phosphopantetheinyl transferase family protein n=1 Tax=Nonomuraea bangladeshensis TaxID=404385 RepID=UPI003C2FF79C
MIEDLMPPGVITAEVFADPPDAVLFPEEAALVARAVEARRTEFTTGRHCARTALAGLGLPPTPILTGPRGEPLWPDGVVGTITHCRGYRAAAVARTPDVLSIGMDAEPREPLPPGVLDAIALPQERTWAENAQERGRLLFTMKESVFKAWYPLTHRNLGFDEAEIIVNDTGTFTAKLLVPGPVGEFTGRWAVSDGFVASAIVWGTNTPSGM